MSVSSISDHQIKKCNGELVVGALTKLGKPVSVTEIVTYIATEQKLDREKILPLVEYVLQTGLNTGFLTKMGNKYVLPMMNNKMDETPVPEEAARTLRRSQSSRSVRRRKSRSKARSRTQTKKQRKRPKKSKSSRSRSPHT